ncbi:MAG: Rho termination factor N-terminal domain-containing protein, partial [Bacteroidota bacterium]|nr:Rho termination factor N-terminal domain-containing protein [Bacteroidota bacterium]
MYDIEQLNAFIVPELKEIAEQFSVKGFKRMAKMDLVHAILDAQADKGPAGGSATEEKPKARKNTKRPAKKVEESSSSSKVDEKSSAS